MTLPYRFLLLAALLASGCSTVPPQSSSVAAAVQPPDPATPVLPGNELTASLLYDLLTAEVALQRGDLQLAARNYLQAAGETLDPRIAKRATRIAIYARNQGLSLEGGRLWVELDPRDPEGRQTLAALLIHAGKVEEAVVQLEAVIAASGEETGQGFQIVLNLLGRETDKKLAQAILDRVTETHRQDPNARFAQAQFAFLKGDQQLALERIDQLLKEKPAWSKALVLKASVLRHLGRISEAIGEFGRAVDADPAESGLRLSYARLLVDERRFDEARAQFEILSRQLPDNPDIVYALGLLALQSGDLERAEREFRGLHRRGHRTDECAFALGQIAETRGDGDEALRWYSSVAEGANYIDARVRIAALVARRDGIEAGRSALQTVRAASPEEETRLSLAESELLRDAGRHADSMAVLDAALQRLPNSPDLLYARAMVAERLERIDQLERDLLAILADDPDNTRALNALGYTLADRTNRYQEAYDYIRRALDQQPGDPAINDSMGWVLFRLGRHQEAETYLRRAAEGLEDPEVAAHLGELCWVTGRKDEARRIWNEGLERAPDNRIIRNAMERLAR